MFNTIAAQNATFLFGVEAGARVGRGAAGGWGLWGVGINQFP